MTQRGSALFYILLGVVLMAALAYTVSNMLRGGADTGSAERAKLGAQALMEYAQKAKLAVTDMKLNGVDGATLSFLKLGDAGYSTAPHTTKVFHPEGGALSLPNFADRYAPGSITPAAGIYMVRMAIENVGTTADDVIVSIRGLQQSVCEQLNKMLIGSTAIPSTGASNHDDLFIDSTADLTAATCAACAGKPALCVSQTTPTIYTFYSAIDPN